jgi:hypothetical protein
MATPSLEQLRLALAVAEQIQALEEELAAILAGTLPMTPSTVDEETSVAAPTPKRRGRPPGKAATVKAAPAKKKKGGMSAAGRARIAAAQRARWAAYNKKKKG